jgi:hypothetical protein
MRQQIITWVIVVVVEEIDVVTLVTLALVGVTVRVFVITTVTFGLNVSVRA